MRDTIDSFMELLHLVYGTPLADILLETVAAAQEHHTMTARIGVNTDGSVSVFSKDPQKAELMAKAIAAKRGLFPISVPPMELGQVRTLLNQPGVLEAFTGDPKPQRTDGWNPAVAYIYLDNLSQLVEASEPLRLLREHLEDTEIDDCCTQSEGRFRALLKEKLDWMVGEMDNAVNDVRAGKLFPRLNPRTLMRLIAADDLPS